ncbi:MAG TPA: cobalamin-binding protein [candidate division Zixibacteria bacterium]|nr:cobalamin-binding protein [candidate division Zixibacteria bacterium]
MRICSLLPGATEIAFALGLGDEIVGVTHECDYPPQARQKTVVVKPALDAAASSGAIDRAVRERVRSGGPLYILDRTRLRRVRPDLILTQSLCDVCALDYNDVVAASQSLEPRPRVVGLAPRLLADVFDDIRRVGSAADRSAEADALVRRLARRVAEVEARTRSARRPRVACLEWLDPLFSAGHWVPEMVELAGGRNGLAEKGEPSRRVGWRSVVEFQPEVLILMPCGFDVERTLAEARPLSRKPGWKELPAVAEGRVFAVDGGAYFSRPGPRLVDGLEILAAIMHPDRFSCKIPPEAARKVS